MEFVFKFRYVIVDQLYDKFSVKKPIEFINIANTETSENSFFSVFCQKFDIFVTNFITVVNFECLFVIVT